MKDNPQLESKEITCPTCNNLNSVFCSNSFHLLQPIPSQSASIETVATDHFMSTGYRPNDDYKSYVNGFKACAQWQSNSQQQVENWISVEDRLPEYGEDYNVVLDLKDGGLPVSGIMEFDGIDKNWVYPSSNVNCDCVTHWQPLPNKPQ